MTAHRPPHASATPERPDAAAGPTRRDALKRLIACGAACAGATALTALGLGLPRRAEAATRPLPRLRPAPPPAGAPLAIARGSDPAATTRAAMAALGGMGLFVRPGDRVLIKPNAAWRRTPEQAATTHPAVVATLVALCREAGAKDVLVTDITCNDAVASFDVSGIRAAALQAGARVDVNPSSSATAVGGRAVADWPILDALYACDCFINVPVAKDHGSSGITASLKNVFGVAGGDRGLLHQDLDAAIVDLAQAFPATLTVIDATRVLMRSGPTGGRLSDVKRVDAVAAGIDPVALDAFATECLDRKAADVGHLRLAAGRGLGQLDYRSLKPREVRA